MLKYLIEIKHRFILINLNLLFNLISIYFYKETILFIVVEPTISTCFKEVGSSFYFIFTDITEIFATYSKLIFFLSGQISFAYFIYHFFLYLSPGMFFSEHRKSKGVLKLIFCI